MSPLRHAIGWLAMVCGAAFVTAALWPPASLQPLRSSWESQLAEWSGTPRALQIASAVPPGHLPELPELLALRASTLVACLWLLVPLWLAAALQGWLIGDRRRTAFAAANPVVHAGSAHAAIAIAGALLLALALPLDVPVRSIPLAGVLLALAVALHFVHRPAWRG